MLVSPLISLSILNVAELLLKDFTICFLVIYELSRTFMDEIYLSANLTLKPGSSDSFIVGIKTSRPVGVLLTTAPLHTPVRDWLAARPTESAATEVTVLKLGSPAVADAYVITVSYTHLTLPTR